MKKNENPMSFVGLTHNYYVDYILGGYLLNAKRENRNPSPKEFEQWVKLVFQSPIPPFNSMFLKPIPQGQAMFSNVDLLEYQGQKGRYHSIIEKSIEYRNTPIQNIENINEAYNPKELEILVKLVDYLNTTKKPSQKQIKELEKAASDVASKENVAMLSAIFSVATHSNSYWKKEVLQKTWYLDIFGQGDNVFAKEGGSVTGADVVGAIVGGVFGGLFGGGGGALGGAIGGSLVASCVQAYNNKDKDK